MADPDDPAEAAARLEQALERIASLANRAAPVASVPLTATPPNGSIVDTGAVAARLDALIAQLREALADRSGC